MHLYYHLSLVEREELSRGLAQGLSLRFVAASLGRSPGSLSREVRRNAALTGYRACTAERRAKKRAALPRRRRFTVLRTQRWNTIQDKVLMEWSPEQISSWLENTYAEADMHVSHETIYTALYVLPRGTLRLRRKRGGSSRNASINSPNLCSREDHGLLRQYFPKGTDLTTVTAKDLRFVEDRLNGRPRKVLQFLTPNEVFTSYLSVALGS